MLPYYASCTWLIFAILRIWHAPGVNCDGSMGRLLHLLRWGSMLNSARDGFLLLSWPLIFSTVPFLWLHVTTDTWHSRIFSLLMSVPRKDLSWEISYSRFLYGGIFCPYWDYYYASSETGQPLVVGNKPAWHDHSAWEAELGNSKASDTRLSPMRLHRQLGPMTSTIKHLRVTLIWRRQKCIKTVLKSYLSTPDIRSVSLILDLRLLPNTHCRAHTFIPLCNTFAFDIVELMSRHLISLPFPLSSLPSFIKSSTQRHDNLWCSLSAKVFINVPTRSLRYRLEYTVFAFVAPSLYDLTSHSWVLGRFAIVRTCDILYL